MALASGHRLIARMGNGSPATSWPLDGATLIPGQTYYWSVQALDIAFSGSAFAIEDSFRFGTSDVIEMERLPSHYSLYQNTPNPRHSGTVIVFDLLIAMDIRMRVNSSPVDMR